MDNNFVIGAIVFLFGSIFGSFYNVVIYRLPLDMSIAKGRSMCFTCKHSLGFFDLFPIFSYIFLGGKCRYCKTKYSPRYALVELLTAVLFLVAYLKFSISYEFLLMAVFWSMLVIVAFIDLDTMSIYDIVLIVFSGIMAVILLISKGMGIIDNLFGSLIGAFIYYSIYFISKMVYKQEAFGFGDVLLNASIGLVLGKAYIVISSFLSFFVGVAFIGIFSLLGKKFKIKQEIPFGPYMCIAAFIVCVFGDEMVSFYIQNFLR